MRIIAGQYRGRKLKSPPYDQTRPTSDRLRETLFNVLMPRIEGARFLDLCSGTGAVGIEALSRGASHVAFVDKSRKMRALIEANLDALEIDETRYEIVTADAFEFLRRRMRSASLLLDIVFYDPPYATDYADVLEYLGSHAGQLLDGQALVVVEHHKKKGLPAGFGNLVRYRELTQGDSGLSFYQVR